jgi:hypothetical protein
MTLAYYEGYTSTIPVYRLIGHVEIESMLSIVKCVNVKFIAHLSSLSGLATKYLPLALTPNSAQIRLFPTVDHSSLSLKAVFPAVQCCRLG